jgi:hemolysin III
MREPEPHGSIAADPGAITWDYSRREIIADMVIHVIGVCFGLFAGVSLLAIAATFGTSIRRVRLSQHPMLT